MKTMYLVAEYCPGPFYMGWHLYLRESPARRQRNADGEWGWLRRASTRTSNARDVLRELGITDWVGDETTDAGAYAEFARRFPDGRKRVGGKPRGIVAVHVAADGTIVGAVNPCSVTSEP